MAGGQGPATARPTGSRRPRDGSGAPARASRPAEPGRAREAQPRDLLRPGPALDLALAPERFADVAAPLRVEQAHGPPRGGVLRPSAGVVRRDALLDVLRYPDVQAAVGALDHVDVPRVASSGPLSVPTSRAGSVPRRTLRSRLPFRGLRAQRPLPLVGSDTENDCDLVGGEGIEPSRPFGHRILSPKRLPFRHPPTSAAATVLSEMQRRRL
jgi:hypothetical protein